MSNLKKTGVRKKSLSRKSNHSQRTSTSYRSPAFAAIHEAAAGLHHAGMIDNTTMREFDDACLTRIIELSPAKIRKIRAQAHISQSVFAAHLNVTTGIISKWERGEKQPRGPAAKLLSLAAKNGIASIA